MNKLNFNPSLIHAMIGKSCEDIHNSPSVSALPGTLPARIVQNSADIPRKYPKNEFVFVCKQCGKRGRYDVGHISIDLQGYRRGDGKSITDYIQMTGYFRCKFCNSAGEWGVTQDFQMKMMQAIAGMSMMVDDPLYSFSMNQMYDGFRPKYGSDAEEHLLTKIMDTPKDSYLWNRLGNAYFGGGRSDLAASSFEHSLVLDHLQMESYFSLGMIIEILDPETAVRYYHKMLAVAPYYKRLKPAPLKELVAAGLNNLLHIIEILDEQISVMPLPDVYEELGLSYKQAAGKNSRSFEGTLELDNLRSFYPLAEWFIKQ